MPHGWAMAEFFLLLRDSLAFEAGDVLVLLAGVPPAWLKHPAGFHVQNLPTHFGALSLACTPGKNGARLEVSGARPPGGFVWRIPTEIPVKIDGRLRPRGAAGDVRRGAGEGKVQIELLD